MKESMSRLIVLQGSKIATCTSSKSYGLDVAFCTNQSLEALGANHADMPPLSYGSGLNFSRLATWRMKSAMKGVML